VNGRGRMPGFPQLTPSERNALLGYVLDTAAVEGMAAYLAMPPAMLAEFRRMAGSRREPYLFTGYERFRDPDGYPAIVPPWGTLNAINLNTGSYLWSVPLGEHPELMKAGMGVTGSENWGGPLLTAARLLFIGATVYDRKFRAFDPDTGRIVWETQLPYAGVATPITYSVGGRQYVVIATSGSRDPKGPQGSAYVAFALPPASDIDTRSQ
jgi:quinoprotein glucose dehydrogenase